MLRMTIRARHASPLPQDGNVRAYTSTIKLRNDMNKVFGSSGFRIMFVAACVMHLWNLPAVGQAVTFDRRVQGSKITFTLSNEKVEYKLLIDSNRIISEELKPHPAWSKNHGGGQSAIETDANFS